MASPYKTWPGLQSHALGIQALALRAEYYESVKLTCRLSPLIAMSDPKRTPNILSWAKSLPEHCALIYRYDVFNKDIAQALVDLTKQKNQQLLIRGQQAGFYGTGRHFKRNKDFEDIISFQKKQPLALITMPAIKKGDYHTPLPKIDGLFVSSIFPSQSPSAGTPIGIEALKNNVKKWPLPIYALGGVNETTAPLLQNSGVAGIAAIDGFTKGFKMTENTLNISKEETPSTITFKAKISNNKEEAVLNLSKVSEGVFNAHHTGVPKSMGGRGVGTALVKAMSEDARNNHYKVIPGCPFVATWFKRKPEWAEMAEAR